MKTVISLASVAVVSAQSIATQDQICLSVCHLVTSNNECKRMKLNDRNICDNLRKDATGTITFDEGMIPMDQVLTVADAKRIVHAPENNCFAMYYENQAYRNSSQYCDSGYCKNLFWDRPANLTTSTVLTFSLNTNPGIEVAPVVCDVRGGDFAMADEVHKEQDPCKALCSISHSEDECKLVQRRKDQCFRLFWASAAKDATVFSVRHPALPVIVTEARDVLRATTTCEDLCKSNVNCRSLGSFCERGVCHGLTYDFGQTIVGGGKMYVSHENDRTHNGDAPVFCEATQAARFMTAATTTSPGGADGQPKDDAANTDGSATTTKAAGAIAVVAALLISLM